MTRWLTLVAHDIAHAFRSVGRRPGAAAVAIVSLGLGIGVNTVVFSWIQARLFNPLPGVPGSVRLHQIEPRNARGLHPGMSWPEYVDMRQEMQSFQQLIAFRMVPFYVGEPGQVDRAYGMLVSDNYFSALGVRPALGRLWTPDEARPGGPPIAVVSHDFWLRRFGGAADAVGRTLRVNGQAVAIAGVAPDAFQGTILGLQFDVWVPASLAPTVLNGSRELNERGSRGYTVMGWLQPGVTRTQAQSEADATMARLARDHPGSNTNMSADVLAFADAPRGPQRFLTIALIVLLAITLLLLLAVCGNIANLVTARASARHHEIGVRLTLGASPARVASLLLMESIVLGLCGAVLGAAIGVWGTDALRAMPPLRGLPIKFQTEVDLVTLAFTAALGTLAGVVAGLPSAIHLARVGPLAALRAGRGFAGSSRLRSGIMGAQVTLAILVLIAAAVFIRSFLETRDVDPGFQRDTVLIAAYDYSGRPGAATLSRAFATTVLERLAALPGVEAAAIASNVPLDIHGLPVRYLTVEGRPENPDDPDQALTTTMTRGYLDVLGIPLVEGKDVAPFGDTAAQPHAIVNQEFVRRYFHGTHALGKRVTGGGTTYTVVGVARDAIYNAFGEKPTPMIYFSYANRSLVSGEIHVRASHGSGSAFAADVRRLAKEIDAELPVYNVRTMSEHIEANLFLRRVPARMFAILGPALLVLTSIGIYGVVSYAVSLRTNEIGVRLALGASPARLILTVMAGTMRVVFIGAAIGTALAAVAARAFSIRTPSGGVASVPLDASVFVGIPALLVAIAALACWLPARRAAAVDPLVAIRAE
jgi:predicted permease